MRRERRSWGRRTALLLALLLGCVLPGAPQQASAQWTSTGSGPAAGMAASLPRGNQPSATRAWALFTNYTATVTWTASTGPAGPVTGYVVRRYAGGTLSPVTTGTCTGASVGGVPNVVTTTTCDDQRGGDAATYTYRIQPVFGSWTGAESLPSAAA